MNWLTKALIVSLAYLLSAPVAATAVGEGTLVIVDGSGKEQKLKACKFLAGTRRLGWLEPAAADKGSVDPKRAGPRPPTGPEALLFREENSTDFENGILTLVPLDRIRSIEYDNDRETVTLHVAGAGKTDGDIVLTGETKYAGTNKLVIEAEVDLGDLGVAEKKFLGGVRKGIRAVRFPAHTAPSAPPSGRPAAVTGKDKDKSVHAVTDLQPLYRLAGGGERQLPSLTFKKTLRVGLEKIRALEFTRGPGGEIDCQLSLKNGDEHTLTLLRTTPLDGGTAALEGFVGVVAAGFKEFPVHTIAEIRFDGAKSEPKEKPKDTDK